MFINDTARLPESGRVCVMAFQARSSATPAFYSVDINAARAEFEPMDEPRNPAHVLGVGSEIQSVKGPVFAAYFAASRDRFDAEPNYKGGLFVLVDGAVYAVRQEKIATTHPPRLQQARIHAAARRPPATQRRVPWPWYREPFVSTSPGHRGFSARDVGHGARLQLTRC